MRGVAEATMLVTGATDGLGKRVARELAAQGATVLLHGRSRERLEATFEEVREQTGNEKLRSYLADLSSLGEVRELAEQVLSEHDRLGVLVNNAGIISQERRETKDGYELTFAVNYLSHFLLTSLLLPLLHDSAPARIVNVASEETVERKPSITTAALLGHQLEMIGHVRGVVPRTLLLAADLLPCRMIPA